MTELLAVFSWTSDDVKVFFMSPAALFLVMLFASFGSMMNQLATAARCGVKGLSFWSYVLHGPEVVAMLVANVIGFFTLLLSDQLNFASAVGIGWVANSVADQIRSKGRASNLLHKKE